MTYVANGDEVVGFEGADDVAEEDEAAEDAQLGGDVVKSTLRSTEVRCNCSRQSRASTSRCVREALSSAYMREHLQRCCIPC